MIKQLQHNLILQRRQSEEKWQFKLPISGIIPSEVLNAPIDKLQPCEKVICTMETSNLTELIVELPENCERIAKYLNTASPLAPASQLSVVANKEISGKSQSFQVTAKLLKKKDKFVEFLKAQNEHVQAQKLTKLNLKMGTLVGNIRQDIVVECDDENSQMPSEATPHSSLTSRNKLSSSELRKFDGKRLLRRISSEHLQTINENDEIRIPVPRQSSYENFTSRQSHEFSLDNLSEGQYCRQSKNIQNASVRQMKAGNQTERQLAEKRDKSLCPSSSSLEQVQLDPPQQLHRFLSRQEPGSGTLQPLQNNTIQNLNFIRRSLDPREHQSDHPSFEPFSQSPSMLNFKLLDHSVSTSIIEYQQHDLLCKREHSLSLQRADRDSQLLASVLQRVADKKRCFECHLVTQKGNQKVKMWYDKDKALVKFTSVDERPPRFLCFPLPRQTTSLKLASYLGYSFTHNTIEQWRCVEVRTTTAPLKLEFQTEQEMTEAMIALNALRNRHYSKDTMTTSSGEILAQVLRSKLEFIAYTRLQVKSAPIILAIGLLNCQWNIKHHGKQIDFENKIWQLQGVLLRVCVAEIKKGLLTQAQFQTIKLQFVHSKETIKKRAETRTKRQEKSEKVASTSASPPPRKVQKQKRVSIEWMDDSAKFEPHKECFSNQEKAVRNNYI